MAQLHAKPSYGPSNSGCATPDKDPHDDPQIGVAIDLREISRGYPLLHLSRRIAVNDARCTYREMLAYFEETCNGVLLDASLARHPWLERWVIVLPLALSTLLRDGFLRHPSFTPARWPETY